LNKNHAVDVARATSHWLAYKSLAGFERSLSEATLSTPIAEYLFGHGGQFEPEGDYNSQFPSVTKGHIYFDVIGELANQKFLLEAKFFRASGHARVFVDLVRLALPVEDNWSRFLIVTWTTKPFDRGVTKEFFELGENKSMQFEITDDRIAAGGKELNLGTEVRRQISNVSKLGPLLTRFIATCLARHSNDPYNVGIYCIERNG